MATIQIDDTAARLTRTRSSNVDKGDTVDEGRRSGEMNGVYNMRHRSVSRSSGLDRYSTRARNRSTERSGFDGGGDDEDSGLRNAGDFKRKQVFKGKLLLWLAYQSIGVIYGDIGTSPLYVFSSTFTEEPSHADLIGALSIIIWSLTMMVTLKYVIIILHADNEGEGGTFSCYSLLSRYANITNRDPRELSLIKMERYLTGDLKKGNRRIRSTIEKSTFLRGLLKTMGVLAVSMVMSDGVLTPAQSVLGAVQGLRVVKEDITDSTVIGTTCGILILLFLIQPLGTSKIASAFAPIVIIWLGFNAAFGIYNLALYDHTVLKAFSPSFAFSFLIRNKTHGWKQLGGVLLAFTGVEALFADLGAFSMRAIQLSWLCYTFPCLLLAYIGQAAYISKNVGAYSNPFFNAAPPGTLYPSIIIAVLAAIVASQAIITATFQLLTQIMKLSYFPQIKVVHTSKIFHGQVYVPLLNWLLMIGTILAAAIYKNTTSLGNAYGVCVMFVTFFDTCFVSLTALVVWRASPLLVFFPWLTIACLDGLYLSAALIKVPNGAWFTLTLSGVLACLFILWRYGKENQWKAEAADRFPTSHLVRKREDGTLELTERYGGFNVSKIKGFGIFFDKSGETTPAVFSDFLSKLIAAPEVMVFFHLRPLETPSVPAENRYIVSRLGIPNCYRLVVRHGYMDEVITPDLASLVCKQVRDFIVRQGNGVSSSRDLRVENGEVEILHQLNTDMSHTLQHEEEEVLPTEAIHDSTSSGAKTTEKEKDITDEKKISSIRNRHTSLVYTKEAMLQDLRKLEDAFDHQVLYIIGKVQLKVKPGTNWGRLTLLRAFLWMRENTRTKIANLRVRADKIIEIGFIKEV